MTTRGYAFQDIANSIVIRHGYGSNRSIELFERAMKPSCGCKYTIEDVNWLVDNGWLYRKSVYGTTRGSKQSKSYWQASWHHYYGITSKGWAVANKYLNK